MRLSTAQIYNTQSSLKIEYQCLRIEPMYNVDQPVMKSYFQPQLKLQLISDKPVNKWVRSTVDRLCDA